MPSELALDQRKHVARDLVCFKLRRLWQKTRPRFAETLAIVAIKIPLTAGGLVALHQHVVFASHPPIKKLHTQTFAIARP